MDAFEISKILREYDKKTDYSKYAHQVNRGIWEMFIKKKCYQFDEDGKSLDYVRSVLETTWQPDVSYMMNFIDIDIIYDGLMNNNKLIKGLVGTYFEYIPEGVIFKYKDGMAPVNGIRGAFINYIADAFSNTTNEFKQINLELYHILLDELNRFSMTIEQFAEVIFGNSNRAGYYLSKYQGGINYGSHIIAAIHESTIYRAMYGLDINSAEKPEEQELYWIDTPLKFIKDKLCNRYVENPPFDKIKIARMLGDNYYGIEDLVINVMSRTVRLNKYANAIWVKEQGGK